LVKVKRKRRRKRKGREYPVVLDQAIELGPVEQVTGLVILEILDLRGLPVGT